MDRSMPALINKCHRAAIKSRLNAYAPYSRYKVGASVVAGGGIYSGCNVENASYGATICAERSAILQAISMGASKIDSLTVVTSNGASPCALCLQVLTEFADSRLPIYIATPKKILRVMRLSDLLRVPFRRSDLNAKP